MRPAAPIVVVLCVSMGFLGCPAPEETPPVTAPSDPPVETAAVSVDDLGEVVGKVTIHVLPAAANGSHTVKVDPGLPIFEAAAHPDGLAFYVLTSGKTPRWARVAVTGFTVGSPVPETPCDALEEQNGPSAGEACRIQFPAQDPGSYVPFKYAIALYEQTLEEAPEAEPDLVIDPVGIIKG